MLPLTFISLFPPRKSSGRREVVLGPRVRSWEIDHFDFHESFHFRDDPSVEYSVGSFVLCKNLTPEVSDYDFVYKILAIGEDHTEPLTSTDRFYIAGHFFRDSRDKWISKFSGKASNELLCTGSVEEVDVQQFLHPVVVEENSEPVQSRSKKSDVRFQRYFYDEANSSFHLEPPTELYDSEKALEATIKATFIGRLRKTKRSKADPPSPASSSKSPSKTPSKTPSKSPSKTPKKTPKATRGGRGGKGGRKGVGRGGRLSQKSAPTTPVRDNSNDTHEPARRKSTGAVTPSKGKGAKKRRLSEVPDVPSFVPTSSITTTTTTSTSVPSIISTHRPDVQSPHSFGGFSEEEQEWLNWQKAEPAVPQALPHIQGYFGALLYRRAAEWVIAAANAPSRVYHPAENN